METGGDDGLGTVHQEVMYDLGTGHQVVMYDLGTAHSVTLGLMFWLTVLLLLVPLIN